MVDQSAGLALPPISAVSAVINAQHSTQMPVFMVGLRYSPVPDTANNSGNGNSVAMLTDNSSSSSAGNDALGFHLQVLNTEMVNESGELMLEVDRALPQPSELRFFVVNGQECQADLTASLALAKQVSNIFIMYMQD